MIKTNLLAIEIAGINITNVILVILGFFAVCFLIGVLKGIKESRQKPKGEDFSELCHAIERSDVVLNDIKDVEWERLTDSLNARHLVLAMFKIPEFKEMVLIENQYSSDINDSSCFVRLKEEFVDGMVEKDGEGVPYYTEPELEIKMAIIDRYYNEIMPPRKTQTRNIKELVAHDMYIFPDGWEQDAIDGKKVVNKIFSAGHFEENGELYYVTHVVYIELKTGDIHKRYSISKVRDGETLSEAFTLCSGDETEDFVSKYKLYNLR